jgi:predicted DNA-binding transcriptional regulator YafY
VARSERLLELLQVLRRHRRPVSGAVLAEELGVSLRTVYRDIQSLIAQGASIDGEAGVGFVLRPGFMLPPLMFSEEELEALVLGSRFIARRADRRLADAAHNSLAKIAAVLPADLCDSIDANGLLVAPGRKLAADSIDLAPIRSAIRAEHKLVLDYVDPKGGTPIVGFGRSRSASSMICACWPRGASCARTFVTSAPIESPR